MQNVNRSNKEEALKDAENLFNELKELSAKKRKIKREIKNIESIGADYKWMKGLKPLMI